MPDTTQLMEKLRAMKPKDFIYPGIFLVFLFCVALVFYSATHFITQNINKIFSSEQNIETQALNLDRYTLVAKKLNIEVLQPNAPEVVSENTPTSEEPPTSTTTVAALDKTSITLMVANSTKKSGLAGILAKELESAGFTKPKTSTLTTVLATTTLTIKDSKSAYTPLLLETVVKTYPNTRTATTTEAAAFDAVITIGAN